MDAEIIVSDNPIFSTGITLFRYRWMYDGEHMKLRNLALALRIAGVRLWIKQKWEVAQRDEKLQVAF